MSQKSLFLYSKEFGVSPVSRHFWKRLEGYKIRKLEGLKVGRLECCKVARLQGWKAGRSKGCKIARLEGWKVRRLECSRGFVISPVSRHFLYSSDLES